MLEEKISELVEALKENTNALLGVAPVALAGAIAEAPVSKPKADKGPTERQKIRIEAKAKAKELGIVVSDSAATAAILKKISEFEKPATQPELPSAPVASYESPQASTTVAPSHHSVEDARTALKGYMAKTSKGQARAVVAGFGVAKLTDLDGPQRDELVNKIKDLTAAADSDEF